MRLQAVFQQQAEHGRLRLDIQCLEPWPRPTLQYGRGADGRDVQHDRLVGRLGQAGFQHFAAVFLLDDPLSQQRRGDLGHLESGRRGEAKAFDGPVQHGE